MPRGPKGERRPADVIGAAVMVARIATGEGEDDLPKTKRASIGTTTLKRQTPALLRRGLKSRKVS